MSKKSQYPPPPPNTQGEADRLKQQIEQKQQMPAAHRSGKSGRYKVPAQPDGKTPAPAEEGGVGGSDQGT